jgi:hypothetical protein
MRTDLQYDEFLEQYPEVYAALKPLYDDVWDNDLGTNHNTGEIVDDPRKSFWDVLFHNAKQILRSTNENMVELPEDTNEVEGLTEKVQEFYDVIRNKRDTITVVILRDIFDSYDLNDVRDIQQGGKKSRRRKTRRRPFSQSKKVHKRVRRSLKKRT